MFPVEVFRDLMISEGKASFVFVFLKGTTRNHMKPVHVRVILVFRHITFLINFLPVQGKNILSSFEKVPYQIDFSMPFSTRYAPEN